MSLLDLSVHGPGAWLRLLLGMALLLAPGLAAADRILPRERARFLLAPVLSLTILVVAAMLGDQFLGIPFTAGTITTYAVVATLLIGGRRIRQAGRAVGELLRSDRPAKRLAGWMRGLRMPRPGPALLLVPVVGFVMLVHAVPHLPGEPPDSPIDAFMEYGSRALDGLRGEGYPYPVHVDEHIHFAWTAQVLRDRDLDIPDPYSGEEGPDLLTVGGFAAQRGLDAAVGAIHLVTDVPVAAIFRFLPALWGGYLAALVWFALRPAAGSLPAALFVGILPTSVRFLGPGFLASSPFALPWLLATLAVVARATEARRFFGLFILVWGGFFLHLIIGALCVAVALLGMALRPGDWRDRVSVLVATALPLVWILPDIWGDVVTQATRTHTLPFNQRILLTPGPWIHAFAVAGAGVAFWRPNQQNTPHRVLGVLAVALGASLYASIALGHRSDATYSRLLFVFFLCLAGLAGHSLGVAARAVAVRVPGRAAAATVHVLAVATVAALVVPTGMAHNLEDPYYRIHDAESWQQARDLAAVAGPGDVFLGHPWQAPVMNAASGAYPHAVLYPGDPPVRGEDYRHYLETGGSAQWFAERGIDLVVGPRPPAAPHVATAPGVYRLT